jgi:hypothetical protein
MPYVTLGSRSAKGAADTTGQNKGNWTVQFAPKDLAVTQTEFEVYKIVVTGAAPSATFNVYVDAQQWDTAVYATNNSWDPTQPMPVRYGQTVIFYYSSASSDGHQPLITIWLRYDPSISQIYGVA